MFEGHFGCHEGRVEAIGGAGGGDDGHGTLTVAAVEHLKQVGLLALCGQTRGGSASLNVDNDERQLIYDGQVDGLALQANARSGGRGGDRKSTRLNSSHANISYAVFCLKKKKMNRT